MDISSDQYTVFRDRLTKLLQEASELPGLSAQNATHIEASRRKLSEDEFEIALVGEFQGGKSTTFNSFCDGREISPRGKAGGGLKTSGCIIRAKNISDTAIEEHAIVRWRTPQELLMGFDDMLRNKIQSEQSEPSEYMINLMGRFDPSTKKGQKAIKEVAEKEIKIWNDDKILYDADDRGLIDLIRFGLLVAEYYTHPFIEQLRAKSRFTIDEARRFVVFPEDWQTRWESWDAKQFDPEEVVFAFVAKVDCHLHSPNLERLGCAITDCPGLFASNWDTKVAIDALIGADAVLYLISGDRQLGQSDLKAVRHLPCRKGMIFVGGNCKTHSWKTAEKILPENRKLLEQQGLDIPEENILLYHACLALFAKHMENGVHKMDGTTQVVLKADLGLTTEDDEEAIENKLKKKIERFHENLDGHDNGEVTASYEKSRLPQLLGAAEKFIINRKAGSILIGNGQRVRNALAEAEKTLKLIEDNAQKRYEDCQKEFQDAERILKKFEQAITPQLKTLGESAPEDLAESLWRKLDDNKDVFLTNVSKRLDKEKKKIAATYQRNMEVVKESINKIVRHEFIKWLEKQSMDWRNEIRGGRNVAYNRSVGSALTAFYEIATLHWEKVQSQNIPALKAIVLPVIEKLNPSAGAQLPPEFEQKISDIVNNLNGVFSIGNFVAWAATFAIVVGLATILGPFALIAAAAFPLVRRYMTPGGAEKMKREMAQEFPKLKDPIKLKINNAVEGMINDMRIKLDNEVVKYPRQVYTKRKMDAEALFQDAEGDRMRKAVEAQEIRELRVAPLRKNCDRFLAEIEPLFAAANG